MELLESALYRFDDPAVPGFILPAAGDWAPEEDVWLNVDNPIVDIDGSVTEAGCNGEFVSAQRIFALLVGKNGAKSAVCVQGGCCLSCVVVVLSASEPLACIYADNHRGLVVVRSGECVGTFGESSRARLRLCTSPCI